MSAGKQISRLPAIAAALALLTAALLGAPRPAAAQTTPQEVLEKVYEQFAGQGIRTLARDEHLSVTPVPMPGGVGGVALKKNLDSFEVLLRYYYGVPDKHALKVHKGGPVGYRAEDPSRLSPVRMDEMLVKKALRDYTLEFSPEEERRGRPCHVLQFVPRPGKEDIVRQTWFIDKEKLIVIESRELERNEGGSGKSRTLELYYNTVNGILTLTAVLTREQTTSLPAIFVGKSHFGAIQFNRPLADSIFEEGQQSGR